MKNLLLILTNTLLISCTGEDIKFIRKEIKNDRITVKWFYYSYISNVSPDFVNVYREGKETEIYKATRAITDVRLNNDSIILKVIGTDKRYVFTKEISKEAFGYKIVLDTAGSFQELQNIPDGRKENELN